MPALTFTELQSLIDRFNRYFDRLKPDRDGLFYMEQVFMQIYPSYYQAGMLTPAQHKGLTEKLSAFQRRVREVEAGQPDPYRPYVPPPPVGFEPTIEDMVPLPVYDAEPEYYEFVIRDTATVEFRPTESVSFVNPEIVTKPFEGGTVSPGTSGLPTEPVPITTPAMAAEEFEIVGGVPYWKETDPLQPIAQWDIRPSRAEIAAGAVPTPAMPYLPGFDIKKAAIPLVLGIGSVAIYALLR